MQLAVQNVIKNYPVVGVLEKFNDTLVVLEKKLPHYFLGAKDAFYNDKDYKIKTFSNHENKKHVSVEVRKILKEKLKYEVEFYQFCNQRLQKQFLELQTFH